MKALTDDLARALAADTPEAHVAAHRIREDIAVVYRAAGLHYPEVSPVERDADSRRSLLCTLAEELRRETVALAESAAAAIGHAQLSKDESRKTVRRARAIRRQQKH